MMIGPWFVTCWLVWIDNTAPFLHVRRGRRCR